MRRSMPIMLLAVLLAIVPGCGDRNDLEEITLGLMLGVDMDEQDRIVYYLSSPVFSKEAKKKNEEYAVRAITMRESRGKLDTLATGLTVRGKVQLLLIGKRLLQQKDWFSLLDVVYRDTKFAVNAKAVAVDGAVSDVIFFSPPDKPRLPQHMVKLIDTANRRNITVKTTLQELHRQKFEKGMTASISEVKKDKDVVVKGTALLDEHGNYTGSLGSQETALLLMLQRRTKGDLSLMFSIPSEKDGGAIDTSQLNLEVNSLKVDVRTAYEQDKFRFDISVHMMFGLVERLFRYDIREHSAKLQRSIEEQMKKQLDGLMRKFQAEQIDPIGLGLYARAHQYDAWKQVQDDWGGQMAKADINVSVKVKLKNMGAVK
ncbi:Ger(x)C family spore germination protein [Paenibacillus mesophilus]|uniref:Ger(x)C family spore germination protein n=1 Tax=Paenibacillus mesophilus TaxID=2582849 RepID=UPI00110E90B2|nr:Ger(x)C family spore germination protein [Paenibacillus mesophilus]TMV47417.1 Ger(x)C family spore germination protein [Paenibacillus mesophilus]